MEVYKICGSCKGTGELTFHDIAGNPTREPITCPRCLGEKELFWGHMQKIGNIVATYQVSEATDATEWNALSDGQKDAYAMILSMGTVDLTDGTSVRTTLWGLFDSESDTRAALIELLGE